MGDDVSYMAPDYDVLREVDRTMRPEDRLEALALGFSSGIAALVTTCGESSMCLVAVSTEGDVLGVGGLITKGIPPGYGVPWAILTEAGARRKRWVVREARKWLAMWSRDFDLRNMVHQTNHQAIDFISVLGFKFGEPYRVEATGETFVRFGMPRVAQRGVPVCASSSPR